MKRKYSSKNLSGLWENSTPKMISLKENNPNFNQVQMDDLCSKAELATSLGDYAYIICNGVSELLNCGVEPSVIKSHQNLFQKILFLGKDLMECSNFKSEMFFLGAFVELKILEKWKDLKFYSFMLSALKSIRKNVSFLSKRIKQKVIDDLRLFNFDLYRRYYFEPKVS